MKNRKLLFNTIIFMLVFTISITIGYSIFSNTLEIRGTAKSKQYISGDKLLVDTLKLDTVNNRYTISTLPQKVVFEDETLNRNNLSLNYAATGTKQGLSNGLITFKIRNLYSIIISDGKINTSVQGSSNNIRDVNASIDKTTLNTNEVMTCSISYRHNTFKMTTDNVISVIISYNVNGNIQNYFFTLRIRAKKQ